MAVRLKINARAFRRWTSAQQDTYLSAVTLKCHTMAQQAADVQNPPKTIKFSAATRKRRRNEKAKNRTQRTIYPHPSKPGEPPRKRTGFGRRNIVQGYNRQRKQGRVGYTRAAIYMAYHEVGIRYSRGRQQRPTIMPIVHNKHAKLVAFGKASVQRRGAV